MTGNYPRTSDHNNVAIELNLPIQKRKVTHRPFLRYRKQNKEQIETDLTALRLEFDRLDLDRQSTEDLWAKFCQGVTRIISIHIPTKTPKGHKKLPWITETVIKLIRKKNKLFTHWKRSGKPNLKARLDSIKKTVKKEMHLAYSHYLQNLIERPDATTEHRSKQNKFWSYIKSVGKDTSSIPPLKRTKRKDSWYRTQKGKQTYLTNSIPLSLPRKISRAYQILTKTTRRPLPVLVITVPGVHKLLEKIKPNKATGPDNIPARFLKEYSSFLAPILTTLFERSVAEGMVPEEWKTANVVPVFKKGNKHDASNYRPVSLTTILLATSCLTWITEAPSVTCNMASGLAGHARPNWWPLSKSLQGPLMHANKQMQQSWTLRKHLTRSPTRDSC